MSLVFSTIFHIYSAFDNRANLSVQILVFFFPRNWLSRGIKRSLHFSFHSHVILSFVYFSRFVPFILFTRLIMISFNLCRRIVYFCSFTFFFLMWHDHDNIDNVDKKRATRLQKKWEGFMNCRKIFGRLLWNFTDFMNHWIQRCVCTITFVQITLFIFAIHYGILFTGAVITLRCDDLSISQCKIFLII